MSQITYQEHDKFKVFVGPLGDDHALGTLAQAVSDFAVQSQAAAKSIGAEYVESQQHLVLTLGYRNDEPAYPVTVQSISLGKIDTAHPDTIPSLEQKIEEAGSKFDKIICHCPYITSDNEFFMVFLLHQA